MVQPEFKLLSSEATGELQALLSHISKQPGVVGLVLIDLNGVIIVTEPPNNSDFAEIGQEALRIFNQTESTTTQIGHNRLHQIVCFSQSSILTIADFGGGVLVTMVDSFAYLIPIMRQITALIAS